MVQERDDIVASMPDLMHPQVWSRPHVGSFSDPLVECARAPALPARRAAGTEELTQTDIKDPEIVDR